MSDWKETQDTGEAKPQPEAKPMFGETGKRAMQGDDLQWTAQDGTADHVIYQYSVEDALDDPDQDVYVYNNEKVTNPDGSQGVIDTRINNTIIDYKTNDMSLWSVSDARRFGYEHGRQVQGYVESPDTPDNARGYIIAAGRPPRDPKAQEAYTSTLAEHGIGVKYTAGGEPDDIVNSVNETLQDTQSQT